MDYPKNLSASARHWLDLICQCRTSGKSDYQWLQEHNICAPTFYYHVKQLRKKACAIPESIKSGKNDIQEVVPLVIEEPKNVPEPVAMKSLTEMSAVRLNIQGIFVEITNSATQELIQKTLSALRLLC